MMGPARPVSRKSPVLNYGGSKVLLFIFKVEI